MNLTIPIYVESRKPPKGSTTFLARPLFFPAPQVQGEKLDRLLARLAKDLGQHLAELGRQPRHDRLAAFTFYPTLSTTTLSVTLELRRSTQRCRFLFVAFEAFGRRVAFTPGVPEAWFDLNRHEDLAARATEALTRHFRELERKEEGDKPEALALSGTAYVQPLELSVPVPAVPPKPKETKFLALGDDSPADGFSELNRVGRCLDWLYPDDLDRVLLRDAELAELTTLLTAAEPRPVLLVGPRQVGKTALVHEFVFRRVAQRKSAFQAKQNVWLLAPSRLISGMSFVGAWENRLLAILRHAEKRDHVLYFDDLLGLFLAGQSAQSTLSVADVLKPWLERRRVRVLGEITPEALRVLRERDRGFADLFHVLPVPEPAGGDNLRMLLAVQRQLEDRHLTRFDLEVLPTVLDLTRRFSPDLAYPGKAATFLRQLAVKHAKEAVTREQVLAEFHHRSGLAVTFLDRQARLERETIVAEVAKKVVGQEAAVEAVADVVSVAKARLNDPHRPLAAFLFLGPTGVGKTQCARAVAAYLFGSPERLVRFDLNEFGEPGSAARLVGTFGQPEGLLTSAIRRQPFAVILFDEIEKADGEVFDLLLQVLGEGRLTDALGRTADFSSALILLTSNLGVREAEGQLGYRTDAAATAAVYVRAAERFFRPEFFNRLDRVLPFRRLTREEVRQIARLLLDELFSREGLVQRHAFLAVEPPALEWIVDQGFDPVLGARALKRSLERNLARPVAEQLAIRPPGGFTSLRVYPAPAGLQVRVTPLAEAPAAPPPSFAKADPAAVLRQVRAALRRLEEAIAPLRPAGAFRPEDLGPEHHRYFALRGLADELAEASRRLQDQFDEAKEARRGLPVFAQAEHNYRGAKKLARETKDGRVTTGFIQGLAAAQDIGEYLRDLVAAAVPVADNRLTEELTDLAHRTALLEMMTATIRAPQPERILLRLRGHDLGQGPEGLEVLRHRLAAACRRLHLEVEAPELATGVVVGALILTGPHAWPLAQRMEGGYLVNVPGVDGGRLLLVDAEPLAEDATPAAASADWQDRRAAWLADLVAGRADLAGDPACLRPVVQVHYKDSPAGVTVLDTRTGMVLERTEAPADLAGPWLAQLPLPAELAAAVV